MAGVANKFRSKLQPCPRSRGGSGGSAPLQSVNGFVSGEAGAGRTGFHCGEEVIDSASNSPPECNIFRPSYGPPQRSGVCRSRDP